MHLAINATELGRQRGGNESYLWGLLDGLRPLPDTEAHCTLIVSRESMRPLATWPGSERFNIVETGPWQRWPSYLWQQTRTLRRLRPDWYLANFLLPPVVPCRAAVVVHDLSFCAHPEYFPVSIALYMTLLVGRAVRRAQVVIAVSEFTRREMQRFYPFALPKTVVVHNGVGHEFTPESDPEADRAALREYDVELPYILAVGNIHPRKNLARLLDAYERLKTTRSDLPAMVWVGVERWGSSRLQQRARTVGVRLTGRVAPEHLPAFYRQASLLVYPSLYEGFGFPPVEAMACGTPVVTSSTTSLPEVVGEAALLVEPADVAALVGAMEQALYDPVLRGRLRTHGLEQAKRFSWTQAAEQVLTSLRGAEQER
jgi:glycosyltransferase involved in cell wall biosynthesis